ncbi:MAG: carbamoyltransferase C-terminal domain-containing protein [Nitrospirales bacterium]|nr:hypothetical protein [Nitrospirales bacterium]
MWIIPLRVQTVSLKTNPRYYQLLKAFEAYKPVAGVLINTSFNVRGEPIVCTPGGCPFGVSCVPKWMCWSWKIASCSKNTRLGAQRRVGSRNLNWINCQERIAV